MFSQRLLPPIAAGNNAETNKLFWNLLVTTGERNSSTVGSSSFMASATSSQEVNEMHQQMQDAIAKQEQLQKQMEEMRACEEAAITREQEPRKREEVAQKRFEDLQGMILSRLGPPPRVRVKFYFLVWVKFLVWF